MTKRRIEILSRNITKKGASLVDFNVFDFDPSRFPSVFVIISKDMPYDYFMSLVPEIHKKDITKFHYVDCEWVSDCLRESKYIDPTSYFIFIDELKSKWNPLDQQPTYNRMDTPTFPSIIQNKLEPIDDSPKMKEPDLPQSMEEERNEFNLSGIEESEMWNTRKKVKHNPAIMSLARPLYDYNFDQENRSRSPSASKADTSNQNKILVEDQTQRDTGEMAMEGEEHDDIEEINDKDNKSESYILKWYKSKGRIPNRNLLIEENTKENQDESKDETKVRTIGDYLQSKRTSKKIHYPDGPKVIPTENLNSHLTEPLERILAIYEAQNDQGKVHGYKRAIETLRSYPKKIIFANEAKNLYGIGPKILEKIREILATGQLTQVKQLSESDKNQVVETFLKIWGMERETANRLYELGLRTIDDLSNREYLLTSLQQIGLRYYHDFQYQWTRDQIKTMYEAIKRKTDELSDIKGIYEVACAGAYRRGHETSGELVICFTRKDGGKHDGFLRKLVQKLEGGFLTDHISLPKEGNAKKHLYIGVGQYEGIHIKVNLIFYQLQVFGYGLLIWTGSARYVKSLKLLAKQKGLILKDDGLYPMGTGEDTQLDVKSPAALTEEDVYKSLEIEWKSPKQRETEEV